MEPCLFLWGEAKRQRNYFVRVFICACIFHLSLPSSMETQFSVNRAGIPGTILQVYLDSADFHKVLQNCVVIGEVLAYSARIVSV